MLEYKVCLLIYRYKVIKLSETVKKINFYFYL